MTEPKPEPSPATVTADEELLGRLADDFGARLRRGEHPAVDEYVAKCPPLADRIRKVLAAVGMIEQTVTVEPGCGERAGGTIGRYKLLERIGEGGYGVVYMAEQQTPVRRKVALKVIKPGLDTRQVIARFEAERQALALMDHESIAKVLDAGATESGRPYFVMELVHGVPITEYCDRNELPPRERLGLFVQVCRAVQHAHTKGVIHRDIKPGNVLVTLHEGVPVPKVIDFGIAKATGQQLTDKTLFTHFAQLVGTPLYMSPEQAEMTGVDVDTRSDVYSLGVLLYELLTGTTPVDKERLKAAAFDEVRRIIREEEPPRPSTRLSTMGEQARSISARRKTDPKQLGRFVRGELDWIVMRALEKERARRYETANGLARDIERYLRDEPVEACPPSAAYRCRKFARRNRVALAVSSATTVALLLVVASLGWMTRDRAAREEQVRRDRAEQRLRVEESAARALDASDEHLRKGDWQQSLVEARRAESVLASGLAGDDLRRRATQRLADLRMVLRLEEIRTAAPENPVAWDPGALGGAYGRAFREYAVDVEEAEPAAVGARLRGRPIHVQLALALDHWARFVGPAQRKRLLAIARVADPDELRCRVRDAMERRDRRRLLELAEDPEIDKRPAATVTLLAGGLTAVREIDAAARLLRRAQNHHRDDFRINFLLANLHQYHQNPPRSGDAVRYYQAALALRPKSPGLVNNLAEALVGNGQLDEAIERFRESAAMNPGWVPVHSNLAAALMARGDVDEAVACYRRAIEAEPELGETYFVSDALVAFREALERRPADAGAHCDVGIALRVVGKADEATACFRHAIALDPKHVRARVNLGQVLRDQGKLDAARAQYDEALRLPADAENIRVQRAHLGVRLGRFREAAEDYRRTTELGATHHWPWYMAICMFAYLGDADAHGKLSADALERFADSDESHVVDRLARACLLLPLPAAQAGAAVQMGRKALPQMSDDAWGQLAAGFAELRSEGGDPGRAVEVLAKARTTIKNGHAEIALELLQAMALHRAGRAAEARNALGAAVLYFDRHLGPPGTHPPTNNQDLWLISHVLRREAETLIGRPSPQELASLRRQALERELAGLTRDIEQHPGSPAALAARATWLMSHGRFDDAERDYRRLVELQPVDPWHWFKRGCLLAYLGRERDYREHCRAMLAQFAGAREAPALHASARAALLMPLPLPGGAGAEGSAALRAEDLVQRAERARELEPDKVWSMLVMGMAELRTGRCGRAVEWLEKVRSIEGGGWAAGAVAADAYLALAQLGLGDQSAARAALERAARRAEGSMRLSDLARRVGNDIHDWPLAQTALWEAEAAVLGRSRPSPPQLSGPPVAPPPPSPSAPSPLHGAPVAVPGVVQAEDFDIGGQGVAYHDTTHQNFNAAGEPATTYRLESVDLEPASDTGGGYIVGGVREGEWLAYTVDVTGAGPYELRLRVCSPGGGRMHVEFDGKDATGPVTVPETGWNNWTTVAVGKVPLNAGRQVMRITFGAPAGEDVWVCNVNWIEVRRSTAGDATAAANPPPSTTVAATQPATTSQPSAAATPATPATPTPRL